MSFPKNKPGPKDRVANLKSSQPLKTQAQALLLASPWVPWQTLLILEVCGQSCSQGKWDSSGSVTHNGPIAWVGRWLPLLHTCRLYRGLASSPAGTHRNTHALITVFCTPRPGWVQLQFGKCSGCIIPWLTQSKGMQCSPCTRKWSSSKKLPTTPALPKHPLSS